MTLPMRIAIDLQACERADTALTRASLAMVRHMLSHPDGHTFWLAFDTRFPQQVERLRAEFAGLLPPERMLAYELQAPEGTAGMRCMNELIQENFFASRGFDLVFTPGVPALAGAAGNAVSPHFLSAVGVAPGDASAHAAPTLVVEIGADPAHAAQQALRAFESAACGLPGPVPPVGRPALAWIAAKAPEAADAHSRLLAALARSYDIALVLPEPGEHQDGASYTVRNVAWFEQHAAGIERIVYVVADSPRHRFMRRLLARHPGIVFLQDFFLGTLADADGEEQGWRRTLFESHGFTGLADELAIGRAAAAEKYPLNKAVLELATGVMVASNALRAQAEAWYGNGAACDWHCVAPAQEAATQPGLDAAACVAAIEAITQRSPAAHYRALLRAWRSNGCPGDVQHPQLPSAARAIAANQPVVAPRQMLVDVSAMVELDARTGISRVVRSILLALIEAPPPGYRVEAVYGDGGNRSYRYARNFTLALLGADDPGLEDAPIEQRPGDVFVGVDVAASITTQNAVRLADMRNRGVQVYFVIHDILPVLLPTMFAYGTDTYFRKYLETVARHADGLLCTTRAGADTLGAWLDAHPVARPGPLHIGYFHLGADLAASAPSTGLPPDAERVLAATAKPTLLMVGTLEPRKAHAQALAAMELLWSQNVDINLVIVGKPGWMVEALIRKLKAHPRLGTQLFWLTEASDEMVDALYGSCSALLAPSLGEGFGLPLIEAARHGLPIIARRLPVFEEICGGHAFYFEGEAAQPLADAVHAWLALSRSGQTPSPAGLRSLSWAESARRLCDCVVNQHWYLSIPGTSSL